MAGAGGDDAGAGRGGGAVSAVGVGDVAPLFELPDGSGKVVRLAELLARGPVVVFFYPGDFTPVCTIEACAFRDAAGELAEAGASVVGISGDGVERHASFAGRLGLPFPLLSDADGRVRAAYAVGKTLGVLPGRVTYVIDPKGRVRMVYRSQLRPGAHVKRALACVRDLAREGRGEPPVSV